MELNFTNDFGAAKKGQAIHYLKAMCARICLYGVFVLTFTFHTEMDIHILHKYNLAGHLL